MRSQAITDCNLRYQCSNFLCVLGKEVENTERGTESQNNILALPDENKNVVIHL